MRYRIVKRQDWFYPQWKGWVFWHSFRELDYLPGDGASYEKVAFKTQSAAVGYIQARQDVKPYEGDAVVWETGER